MSEIANYSLLIKNYLNLQLQLSKRRVESFRVLLNNYRKYFPQWYESQRESAPNFNPILLFNEKFDELTHSNILAWAFDPWGNHNQGNIFFRKFLEFFNFNIKGNIYDYKVRREVAGKEAIIDILIYNKDFIFYIENKVLSSEGVDQTGRELRDLKRLAKVLNVKDSNIFPIFLSPAGTKPQTEGWTPISYQEIAEVFKLTLNEIRCDYVKCFVSSWVSILIDIYHRVKYKGEWEGGD